MIEIKEQYIVVTDLTDVHELLKKITEELHIHNLNNLLIPISKVDSNISVLASFLEKELETTNGLACFVGIKELMNSDILKAKNHVIALPSEHEGIEAILMNILENEFLKGE